MLSGAQVFQPGARLFEFLGQSDVGQVAGNQQLLQAELL